MEKDNYNLTEKSNEILEFIYQNIGTKIVLEDILEATGLSRNLLSFTTKAAFKNSPIKLYWLIKTIVTNLIAKELSKENDKTIAFFMGFATHEHFSKKTKEVFGSAPSVLAVLEKDDFENLVSQIVMPFDSNDVEGNSMLNLGRLVSISNFHLQKYKKIHSLNPEGDTLNERSHRLNAVDRLKILDSQSKDPK